MQEKNLLINSMQKLINHIVVSRKNQEEIFASLSKNDFKKIISNLEDDNIKLRKISLALITQLLYNNTALKQKFCNIMAITIISGRIALNAKFCPSSSKVKNTMALDTSKNIKQIFSLLKQNISENQRQSLFWFINLQPKQHQPHLVLEYLSSLNPQSISPNDLLDPLDCMIGFILPQKNNKKDNPQSSYIIQNKRRSQYEHPTYTPANRMVNNYFRPGAYKMQTTKNNPSSLNQSLNMTPGYSTDRQPGFKPSIGGTRGVNTSMYQDNGQRPSIHSQITPVIQLKTPTTIEMEGRQKYTGIKLISNNSTKAKDNQKLQQDPMYLGNIGSSKPIAYMNGILGKQSFGGRVERGYQTLREKKQKTQMD